MYKIKKTSSHKIIVRFSAQKDVNYQAICALNELFADGSLPCLLPSSFILKFFKVQLEYNTVGTIALSKWLEVNHDPDHFVSILQSIFHAVDKITSKGLSIQGISFRSSHVYVDEYGNARLIYVPVFDFYDNGNLELLVGEMLSQFHADNHFDSKIIQMTQEYLFGNSQQQNQDRRKLINNPANEGETTLLSPSEDSSREHFGNEGETTILSAHSAPRIHSSNEEETTVLNAVQNPLIQEDSEGETTLLETVSADKDVLSSAIGETTILSSSAECDPQHANDDNDNYHENATCFVDDKYTADHGEFFESETAGPSITNELGADKTLIGAEGLAQSMAYSSIKADQKAAENYETVLLANNDFDKTAFFIRFINSQAIYITKNYFTIGSSADMDYVITGNSLISKYHATVVIENNKFYLIDNNSTNKVYVDGREAIPFEKNEIFTGSRVVLANEIFDFYIK